MADDEAIEVVLGTRSDRWFSVLAPLIMGLFVAVPSFAILAKLFGAPIFSWAAPWNDVLEGLLGLGCLAPIWGSLAAWVLGRRAQRRRRVRLGEHGLEMDGRPRHLAFEDIALVSQGGPESLTIAMRDGRQHTLRVEAEETAALQVLVRALRERVGRRRVRIATATGRSRLLRMLWGVATAMTGVAMFAPRMPRPADIAVFLGVSWAAAALLAYRNRSREVVVGADGVRLPKQRGQPRFVAFRSVRDVEERAGLIILRLRNGRGVPLPTSRMTHEQRLDLIRLMRARMAGDDEAGESVETLHRTGEIGDWIDRLKGLLTKEGFRDAAVTEKAMRKVLEDPDADREERVGAALALMAKKSPESVAKVRVAIDETADEQLEAALEAVLADDPQELARALD